VLWLAFGSKHLRLLALADQIVAGGLGDVAAPGRLRIALDGLVLYGGGRPDIVSGCTQSQKRKSHPR
jgi:hypothetical protein